MKKGAITMAAALLAALFLFLAALAAGCGKAAAPAGQETEGAGEASRQEQAVEKEAGHEQTGDGSTSPAPPSPSARDDSRDDGGGSYSFGPLQIGMGFPPERLQVVEVRWADHRDYFRIVFEIKRMDGSDSDYVPLFGVSYNPDHLSFAMHIDNTTINDPEFATLGRYVSIGDAVVESIAQVMGASSLEGTFSVRLNAARGCRLSYATGPLRLIVDIQK